MPSPLLPCSEFQGTDVRHQSHVSIIDQSQTLLAPRLFQRLVVELLQMTG